MDSITRTLLLASALRSFRLVTGQTIYQNGELLEADKSNVAPAGEFVLTGEDTERFELTDAVLTNLTELKLRNIQNFRFPGAGNETGPFFPGCKTFPGDQHWPSKQVWDVFDLLTGGALMETVPIGAVCYEKNEHYDLAECANILSHWSEEETHAEDPTSVMSPLFQGETCMPQNGNSSVCALGGFPSFSVNVSAIAQIQLAVNFARNLNLRLVVHNTGHDFLGKSTGAGALSIWTHNLKSIDFVENYLSPSYKGPALKLGAGVQVHELYSAADQYDVTAIGGDCGGVGVTGGFIAGGGHSPLSPRFGMASDQVLSIDVVTPDGRFVTADEKNNEDLFWALRGGGGGTFGVVTSMTVIAHPKISISGVSFTISSGNGTNVPLDVFWSALDAYWRKFPFYSSQGSHGYSTIFPRSPPGSGYVWSMVPWTVPEMKLRDFKAMVAPLFEEWASLGLDFEPEYFEYDNYYDMWSSQFAPSVVALSNLRTGSRIFSSKNWEDEVTLNKTLSTLREIIEEGSAYVCYNINAAAPKGTPKSSVNPAWRDAVMFGIIGSSWAAEAPTEEMAEANIKLTDDWMERLREITPGGGGYGNEGDVMEPDFGQAFFGSNYDRLLRIKEEVDPWDVFWAPTAVGSENWYVTGQEDWLTLQTGRLCPK